MSKILILGLCNPGKEFDKTLHNIGKYLIEQLAKETNVQDAHNSLVRSFVIKEPLQPEPTHITLCYSTSWYMNDSGKLLAKLPYFDKLIVLHDELMLDIGVIKFSKGGSARGHNGLRSIIAHYGADFWRVRVGIGHPGKDADIGSYVTKPSKYWSELVEAVKNISLENILLACMD